MNTVTIKKILLRLKNVSKIAYVFICFITFGCEETLTLNGRDRMLLDSDAFYCGLNPSYIIPVDLLISSWGARRCKNTHLLRRKRTDM